MIQPLHPTRVVWVLDWVDLSEPMPSGQSGAHGDEFILPTYLFVVHESTPPLLGQETLRELDQRRAENLLARIFHERGTPDEIVILDSPDWDKKAWKGFAHDFQCEVRIVAASEKRLPPQLAMTQRVREVVAKRMADAVRKSMVGRRSSVVAAGLVRTALQTHSREKRIATLEKALQCDARCSAALLELGEIAMQSGNLRPALGYYEQAVEIETPRWEGFRVDWWVDVETRIYLRALFGKMLVQWHKGKFPAATECAQRLLTLNPRDNQGVRFVFPMLHHLADRPDLAAEFFQLYEGTYQRDYPEPAFFFGWGLTLSQQEDEQAAFVKYRRGMLRNIYIAPLLLDLPEPRIDIWHSNDRSEPGYAYEFFDSFATLWERDPAVLRVLRDAYERTLPDLAKLIELRLRMADFQDQRFDPDHDRLWKELIAEEKAILGEELRDEH